MEEYIKVNKHAWNERTEWHIQSDFYQQSAFLNGQNTLKEIELSLLGDVSGKSILHLQCHFGQDSLSLSRMGAHVTGVDFSEKAIETARSLALKLGLDAEFMCCDVYSVCDQLANQSFDIVFTSYGVIGWLPDMQEWARVVQTMLKPGGMLVLVEFHPVIWMFNDAFTSVHYSYFKREPIIEVIEGTYADKEAPILAKTISWNHALEEVIGCLMDQNLAIKKFKEYDYSPYNCLKGMTEIAPGKFQIAGMEGKLPLVYAVKAVKE
jgi:2-polyprenyl-3-methyl-5-hydroxy-6-metoxy-1,4-benzoquinol methylase